MNHYLLRLWFRKQRHDFRWSTLFIAVYLYLMSFLFVWAIASDSELDIKQMTDKIDWLSWLPLIASTLIIPDFALKIFLKRDTAIMSNPLKTKPIKRKEWMACVVAGNICNFWNLNLPIPLTICAFFVMPPWQALIAFLLFYLISVVDGLSVTVFHTARGWAYKLPVCLGLGAFTVLCSLLSFGIAIFRMPWLNIVFMLLGIGALVAICLYMSRLKNYDEEKAQVYKSHTGSRMSWLRRELIFVWRPSRIRSTLYIWILLFINLWLLRPSDPSLESLFVIATALIYPSLMSAQFMMSVESNFMDGLLTKPYNLNLLFRRHLLFYGLINIVVAFITILILWNGSYLWFILAVTLYAAGIMNPTCLIYMQKARRLNLFQSSFMNMQGAYFSPENLMPLVSAGVMALIYWLLPMATANIIVAATGTIGFALTPYMVRLSIAFYLKHKYNHLEEYRKS